MDSLVQDEGFQGCSWRSARVYRDERGLVGALGRWSPEPRDLDSAGEACLATC